MQEDLRYLDNTGSTMLPGYQEVQVQHRPTFTDYEPTTLMMLSDFKANFQPPIATTPVNDTVGDILRSNKKAIDIFGGFANVYETHERLNSGEFIPKYKNYIRGVDNDKRLAMTQSSTERFFNPLIRTGAKVVRGIPADIVGFVYGLGAAIGEGRFDALYDNSYAKWLDDSDKRIDKAMSNYYSEESSSLTNPTYLWDKVLGGSEFTLRMIGSEALVAVATGGTATPAIISKYALKGLGRAGKIAKAANTAAGIAKAVNVSADIAEAGAKKSSYLKNLFAPLSNTARATDPLIPNGATLATTSSQMLGTMEDVNKAFKWRDNLKMARFAITGSTYEAGFEARHFETEAEQAFWGYYRSKGVEPTIEEVNDFYDKLEGQSNGVFAANMALLSTSNLALFGNMLGVKNPFGKILSAPNKRLFGQGVTTAADGTTTAIKANFAQKALAYTTPLVKGAAIEGVYEEGGQGIASGMFSNYVASSYDPEAMRDTANYVNAFSKAFKDQFSTKDGIEEMVIGGIIGAVFGGFGGSIGQVSKNYKSQDVVAKVMNYAKDNADLLHADANIAAMFANASRNSNIQKQLQDAIDKGAITESSMKQAEGLVSMLQSAASVGKEGEIIKVMTDSLQGASDQSIADSVGIDIALAQEFRDAQIEGVNHIVDTYKTSREFANNIFRGSIRGESSEQRAQMVDSVAYAMTMGAVAEKTAGNLFNTFRDSIGEYFGKGNLYQNTSAVEAMAYATEAQRIESERLDAEIEAKTKTNEANAVKLSQMAIDPNATAEEKRRHVTETAKLQEVIMQVNNEINQLKNDSDLLKNSIIGNYYTATQNGAVTKESLKDFQEKVKSLEEAITNMPDKSKALDLISAMAEFRVANEYYKQFNEIAENFLNPELSFKTYNHFFSRQRTKGKTLNQFTTDFLDSLSTISRFENKFPSVEAELNAYNGGFVSKALARMVQMKEAKGEELSPQEQLVSEYLKGSQRVLESKIRRKELQERRQELMDKLDAYEKSKVEITEEKKPAEEQIADIESDLAEALEEIDNRLVEIEAELETLSSEVNEGQNVLDGIDMTEIHNLIEDNRKATIDRLVREGKPDNLIKMVNDAHDLWLTHDVNDPGFSNIIKLLYTNLRKPSSDYTGDKSTPNMLHDITGVETDTIIVKNQGGWHYRIPKGLKITSALSRFSLNVKGSPELIAKLDKLASEYGIYYKTPENGSDWDSRTDPITIYVMNPNLTEAEINELKKRVVAESKPHIRDNTGFGFYGENLSEGVEYGKDPSVEDAQKLVDIATKVSKTLGKVVRGQLTSPTGKFGGSAGQHIAVIRALTLLGVMQNSSTTQQQSESAEQTQLSLEFEQALLEDRISEIERLEAEKTKTQQEIADINSEIEALDIATRKDSGNLIDALGLPMVYTSPITGKELHGTLMQEGESVVFSTKNEIYEIGEFKKLRRRKLKTLGLKHPEEVSQDGNKFTIRGSIYTNLYSDPSQAINRDTDGNVVSVTLTDSNGRPRTFRGYLADNLAYGILRGFDSYDTSVDRTKRTVELQTQKAKLNEKLDELNGKIDKGWADINGIEQEERAKAELEEIARAKAVAEERAKAKAKILAEEQALLQELENERKAILEQEKEQLELEKIRLDEEAKFGINFVEKVLDNFDQQAERNNLTLEEQAELQNIDNELAEDPTTIEELERENANLRKEIAIILQESSVENVENIDRFYSSEVKPTVEVSDSQMSRINSLLDTIRVNNMRINELKKPNFDTQASYAEQIRTFIESNPIFSNMPSPFNASENQPLTTDEMNELRVLDAKTDLTEEEEGRLKTLVNKANSYIIADSLEFNGLTLMELIELQKQAEELEGFKVESTTEINEEVFKESLLGVEADNTVAFNSEDVTLMFDGVVSSTTADGFTKVHNLTMGSLLKRYFESNPADTLVLTRGDTTIEITISNYESVSEQYDDIAGVDIAFPNGERLTKNERTSMHTGAPFYYTGDIIDFGLTAFTVSGQASRYNQVYEKNSSGTFTQVASDFAITVGGIPIPFDATKVKEGDKVTLEHIPDADYNANIVADEYDDRAVILVKKGDNYIGVLKASSTSADMSNKLKKIRMAVIQDPNSKIEVTVSKKYVGLPKVEFNADGTIKSYDANGLGKYGFVTETGEIKYLYGGTKGNINTQYLDPHTTKGTITPFGIVTHEGQSFAFPIIIENEIFDESSKLDDILNSDLTDAKKIIEINTLLNENKLYSNENKVDTNNFSDPTHIGRVRNQLESAEKIVKLSEKGAIEGANKRILLNPNAPFGESKFKLDLLPIKPKNTKKTSKKVDSKTKKEGKKEAESKKCKKK